MRLTGIKCLLLLSALLLMAAQRGNVSDDQLNLHDITTNNVSISAHGFAPKAPNDATKFLNGTGVYTVPAGTAQLHAIPFGVDGGGSVLTTGDIHLYPPVNFACTINRIDISGYPSGSITVDVWKAATAIPASGNKISASAPLTLSSSQLSQNGSLTGWTTSVSIGDVFGFSIASVTTVQNVTGVLWCQ